MPGFVIGAMEYCAPFFVVNTPDHMADNAKEAVRGLFVGKR